MAVTSEAPYCHHEKAWPSQELVCTLLLALSGPGVGGCERPTVGERSLRRWEFSGDEKRAYHRVPQGRSPRDGKWLLRWKEGLVISISSGPGFRLLRRGFNGRSLPVGPHFQEHAVLVG